MILDNVFTSVACASSSVIGLAVHNMTEGLLDSAGKQLTKLLSVHFVIVVYRVDEGIGFTT